VTDRLRRFHASRRRVPCAIGAAHAREDPRGILRDGRLATGLVPFDALLLYLPALGASELGVATPLGATHEGTPIVGYAPRAITEASR